MPCNPSSMFFFHGIVFARKHTRKPAISVGANGPGDDVEKSKAGPAEPWPTKQQQGGEW